MWKQNEQYKQIWSTKTIPKSPKKHKVFEDCVGTAAGWITTKEGQKYKYLHIYTEIFTNKYEQILIFVGTAVGWITTNSSQTPSKGSNKT